MEENIPETYQLETIEQMRALAADELRVRIVEALAHQAMTSKQLATLTGEAQAKAHYHLHELEKVGLVKLVDIREKGNMLEKYYRAVAKSISASDRFFQSVPPDETIAAVSEFLQQNSQRFMRAMSFATSQPPAAERVSVQLEGQRLWITNEEYKQLYNQIQVLTEPYQEPRSGEEVRQYMFVQMRYPVLPLSAEEHAQEAGAQPAETPAGPATTPAETPPSASLPSGGDEQPAPTKKTHIFSAGVLSLSRNELEATLAAGKQLDIQVLGLCHVAQDVTPELIDRAVARFRCRGKINASPEVREALRRKEVKAEQ